MLHHKDSMTALKGLESESDFHKEVATAFHYRSLRSFSQSRLGTRTPVEWPRCSRQRNAVYTPPDMHPSRRYLSHSPVHMGNCGR